MAIVISINFFFIGFVFSGGNLQNAAGMRCLLTVTSFIYICLWLVLIRWTVPYMLSLYSSLTPQEKHKAVNDAILLSLMKQSQKTKNFTENTFLFLLENGGCI